MRRIAVIASILATVVAQAAGDLASLLVPLPDLQAQQAVGTPTVAVAAVADTQTVPEKDGAFVGPMQILPEIQRLLERQFSPGGELKVSLLQQWRGTRVKHEGWRVELVRVPGNALAPRMVVHLRILCGDEPQGEFQLPVACRVHQEVLVPRRQLNRGEPLNLADFDTQVRDTLETAVPMVPSSEALADYELRTSVAPGQPLFWRDITLRPLVRRGQIVELVAAEGFLRITVKAEALENGRAGDFIAVRNLATRKDIQARIIDEQTVQVYF